MNRVFVSDLHLNEVEHPTFSCFEMFLHAEANDATEIYLLGDLTDVWVGDDDDGPLADGLRQLLKRAAKRCPIFLMHGNRDFLIGKRFADQTGIQLIEDPFVLDSHTLLSHGDAFCVDDEDYQRTRRLFRSPEFQADVLSRSLEERRILARGVRAQSQATNANKAENIMDVSESEVASVVRSHESRRLIHGHTHRPGQHTEPWGKRYVLGAWERCGWLLRWAPPNEPVLECFPLTGRYET